MYFIIYKNNDDKLVHHMHLKIFAIFVVASREIVEISNTIPNVSTSDITCAHDIH